MASSTVIKNQDFQLISEFARTDSKKRLSLGEAAAAGAFNIYCNSLGQIVLDPVKVVPASEAWLYENPKALATVRQGLKESAEGKSRHRGSFVRFTREIKETQDAKE
ncbi:MAG: hypothetical protein SFU85_02665 [Candidatus Methylacidiphilales bacterium]|nr:hypothetical protein [Candidatus Methylacidiphilales bacterium]